MQDKRREARTEPVREAFKKPLVIRVRRLEKLETTAIRGQAHS